MFHQRNGTAAIRLWKGGKRRLNRSAQPGGLVSWQNGSSFIALEHLLIASCVRKKIKTESSAHARPKLQYFVWDDRDIKKVEFYVQLV